MSEDIEIGPIADAHKVKVDMDEETLEKQDRRARQLVNTPDSDSQTAEGTWKKIKGAIRNSLQRSR